MVSTLNSAVTRLSRPSSSSSASASTSLVSRLIVLPDVYRSWNDSGSRWTWVNTRRRRVSSTACPTRPDQVRKTNRSTVSRTAAPSIAAVIQTSGHGSPSISAGTATSMPTPMRNGPASQARFCTVMVASSPHSDALVRREQLAEQPARAGAQEDAGAGGELVGVLGGDPAPVLLAVGAVAGRRRLRGHGSDLHQFALLRQQVAVGRHLGQQFAVRAHRGDPAAGSSATRSASSTVEGRCATTSAVVAGQHVAQRPLDQRLGVHVERRQRVVEDQHRGPAEHRAGQRQPLPLAAGQRQPLLADAGVQTPGQVVDELRLGHPQRLLDVGVGGVGPAEGEVLPHAHREQRRVLEGGRDDAAQLGQRQVAHVDAVHGDPAGGDVVQPADQRGERRLARAGRPDQRDGLARVRCRGRRRRAPARSEPG